MHFCERNLDLEPKGQCQQKTKDNKQRNRNIPYEWPT